jgi:ATP-dependent helicase/nuclease subunit A
VTFEPTSEQVRAISSLEGDLCISAGAGSGKTRVLAERFVAAIDPEARVDGWTPAGVGEVLTVTFTEKAAGEIAERVRRVLIEHGLIDQARRVDEAWISTIHGLCTRLLRTHALEAGLDPRFTVVSTAEAGAVREEVFEQLLRARITDGTASALVAAYGVGTVVELAGTLHDRLRAMGAKATDVTVEEAEAPRVVLASARASVREWARRLAEYPAPGITVSRLVAAATGASEELDALTPAAETDDLIAHEVLRVLHSLKLGGNVGGAKDIVQACAKERASLLDRAVLTVAAPLEQALIELTAGFEASFDAAKTARSVLDFEDLQLRAVDLLAAEHGPAQRYRSLFRLVMIDEFQDTNEVQTALADLLSDGNLCTVGDERQSIYSFRYADVDVYRAHTRRMLGSGAATAHLAANFRSHGDVLTFVNTVFADPALFGGEGFLRLEHGRDERTAPPLRTPDAPRVELIAVHCGGRGTVCGREVEADAVAARLRALVDAGVPQGDIVLLLRAMTHADVYAAALDRHGLDYTIVAGGSFFDRTEIEAVRAFLRAAANPLDDEALAHVLASDMGGLSDDALIRLRTAAGRGPLWRCLDTVVLEPDDREAAAAVKAAVLTARSLDGRAPVAEIVHRACEALDYDLVLLSRGADGRRSYANVLKLARLAGEYERAGEDGVRGFLEHLAWKERVRDREAPAAVIDERAEVVRMMSIHAAKGLEFPVVAVPELGRDLQSGSGVLVLEKTGRGAALSLLLPDDDDCPAEERRSCWAVQARERARARDAEEEKRLLYVACTRAREALVLSGAGNLKKPPDDRPLGWIRGALGLTGEDFTDGVLDVGGALVAVRRLDDDAGTTTSPPRSAAATPPTPAGLPRSLDATPPAEQAAGTPPAVSHSAIALYEKCPLRYCAEKVLRIGGVDVPRDGDPLRFGDAVHAALRLIGPAAEPPPPERLAAIARGWGLSEAEAARLRSAVDGFRRSAACAAAHASGAPAREVPFGVPLDGMTLVGKLDLLATGPGGALVIDYKTGRDAAGPDSAHGYRAQADTYGLAVLAGGAPRADVVFVGVETSEDGPPREVAFRYEEADIPRLRAGLQSRAQGLVSGPYEPLPRYEPGACDDCPAARGICPVRVPARRER